MSDEPYNIQQVQMPDGLYLNAEDVLRSLRGRSAETLALAESAEAEGNDLVAAAWAAVSEAFRVHADMMDVAAIAAVTATPAPWLGERP
jgi:hypothetical protein